MDGLREYAEGRFGVATILVNNAGVQVEKTVTESGDDDWDAVIGANCRGVFNCCRAFIPGMEAAGGGVIVNIGSISGVAADPGMALYNASKAFVHGLTRSIAVDHGPAVRCNAIRPGWIMTGMADAAFAVARNAEQAKRDALARHAAGRFGEPARHRVGRSLARLRRGRLRHRPVPHRRRRPHRRFPPATGTVLMADPNHTAVLGAGVIGASWTALFLAAGKSVAVFDVADDAEETVRAYVDNAWPALMSLGMTERGNPEALTFHRSPSGAIERAAFVQESVPERIAIKHALYGEIEDRPRPGCRDRELGVRPDALRDAGGFSGPVALRARPSRSTRPI